MKITRTVSLLAVCVALSGCAALENKHWYRVAVIEGHETLDNYYGDSEVSAVPTVQNQTLWPAYSCPNFAKHGYEGESQFRTDAMIAAKAAGFDAIAIKFIPNQPPARIEIYEWESDKERGKFRPNFIHQTAKRRQKKFAFRAS